MSLFFTNMLILLFMLCYYRFEIWIKKVPKDEEVDELLRQAGVQ